MTILNIDGDRNYGDENFDSFVYLKAASNESVMTVAFADPEDEDGRSEWFWLRFPNGDLMLATFPQGNTYFATEEDHSS